MTSSSTSAASLPPKGLVGLRPEWSRLVTARDSSGVERTWHVLDNGVREPAITLLAVHGNPTWSYLWRDLLAKAPSDVRVVAPDHLDMGFSDRTGTHRRLEERIADLATVTAAVGIEGPVVTVAHDWGGPISLGWALAHRDQVLGLVLMNTAVHHPARAPAPALIRLARSRGILERLAVRSSGFIRGTLRLARPRLSRDVARAYLAPYRSSARRRAIGDFVADIPLEDDHPSLSRLRKIAAQLGELAEVPALLLWGVSDPVFTDRYLRDLQARLPRADTHRFERAGHLLPEDVAVADTIYGWLANLASPADTQRIAAPDLARRPLWAEIERRRNDHDVAIVEMAGVQKSQEITFSELAMDVDRMVAGFADAGIKHGDRVALLVPPGIDLTVCLYACWRIGAIVVVVDAGLGVAGMTRALKSAAPTYLIGIERALVAARTMRWPGRRIAVRPVTPLRQRALDVWTDLDSIRRRGEDAPLPAPPSHEDVAAVVFTSGATGPAKGVTYRHHQAQAQRDALQAVYSIGNADSLVAAFAPFGLYGAAMGITSAVPDMDVTAPGTLTAAALGAAVAAVEATMVFGSPAALNNVLETRAGLDPAMRAALSNVRLLMSAGAPVSARLLGRVAELVPNAEIHTPYGMTEVLPVADISLDQIEEAGRGDGVCVGWPVRDVEVAISALDAAGAAVEDLTRDPGVVGEVCIRAPHTKDEYDKLWATEHAAANPSGWHRSGDVGHLDEQGRLWIEGRMVHIIHGPDGPITPVGIEHAAATVPGVRRAAAVGVGPAGTQVVVAVIETGSPARRPRLAPDAIADQVRKAIRVDVAAVLEVPALPVDKRHNSKIDRARVAAWAEAVLAGSRVRAL